MMYFASWIVQLLIVLVLVSVARSKRVNCGWDASMAAKRLTHGILIVGFVQIADLARELTEGKGLGILYHISG